MKTGLLAATAAVLTVGFGAQAAAQTPHSPILSKGSPREMRAEVDQRYQAAVAMSRSQDVIKANDERFTWASDTKVACGIAIGFLKTGTVDEESIDKCDAYYQRMQQPPGAIMAVPEVAAAPAAAPAHPCVAKLPIVFYFGWDVAEPPADAAGVAQSAVQQMQACGWQALTVSGYADTSGSTSYNQKLSEERARNVASLLESQGAPAQAISVAGFGETHPAVPTPDGVREPLNRRVEINTAGAQ
jgi:outer membrane protein OmpA-like peptidoglycan-associated protein